MLTTEDAKMFNFEGISFGQ